MSPELIEYLDAQAIVDENRPKPHRRHDEMCCKWAPVLPLLNPEEQTDALAPCGDFEI